MRYALVNPRWSFEGSTYFGCAAPHFPLELLSAREVLRSAGHQVLLVDAFMEDLSPREVSQRLDSFHEDFLVVPTAPSYLFWRCPQPELRVPREWIAGRLLEVEFAPGSVADEKKTLPRRSIRFLPHQRATIWRMVYPTHRRSVGRPERDSM